MDTNKAKSYFWVLLDVLVAGIILNLIFFVMPTIRQLGSSLGVARTVSVSAEGKTTAVPDVALSSFSVVSRGSDPGVLSDKNNRIISAVVDFVKSQGVLSKDIQTTGYDLAPNYVYNPKTGQNSIDGYTFTQTVTVKMRDFSKISDILGGLTPLGVNQIGGITFNIDEPEKFLAIARADALAKARTKAGEMVAQTGAGLGKVVSIGEYSTVPIPYAAEAFGRGGAMTAPTAIAPTIEPGTSEIRDQVTVVYEIR